MNEFSRRQLMRYSAFGLAGALSSKFGGPLRALDLSKAMPQTSAMAEEALVIVFCRGAIDHVYTLPPVGDSTYQAQRDNGDAASTLWVHSATDTLPLFQNSYARLHKNWQKLSAADFANDVAWICRVGNPEGMRSHFEEMDNWEKASTPSSAIDPNDPEGWIPRLIDQVQPTSAMRHANIAFRNQRAFLTTNPALQGAHIRSFAQYSLAASDQVAGIAGALVPPGFTAGVRQGMSTHLTQSQITAIEQHVDATGEFALSSESIVASLAGYAHDDVHFPLTQLEWENARLPASGTGLAFMRACEEALQLVTAPTDAATVVGVEMGGFDTHIDQRATRDVLDRWLAHGLWGLYERTKNLSGKKVHIMVISEFGRTNAVNGSKGTDHGVANTTIVIGPDVNRTAGGVYNMHNGGGKGAIWKELGSDASDALYEDAQEPVRDFRAIYAEFLSQRFKLTSGQIDAVIPNWNSLVASGDPKFQFQNYIAG